MAVAGIEITLRTLLGSANPAATDLLVVALASSDSVLRVGAVRALALREDPAGHRALVERLHRLPPDATAALRDVPPRSPLAASLPRLIDQATPNVARRAVEIAAHWGVFGVLPAAIEAAQWPVDQSEVIAGEVLRLARGLAQAIDAYDPKAAPGQGPSSDPAFDRRAAVNALGNALGRYGEHGCEALLDAMLLLTPPDEPALLRVIRDPQHAAYEPLRNALRHGRSRGALGVLAWVLRDPSAPDELLRVAAERADAAGLGAILQMVGYPLGLRCRENCKRLEQLAWLETRRQGVLLDLPDKAQASAIQLAAASSASRRRVSEAITMLLEEGGPVARLAAARAIASLPSHLAIDPLTIAIDEGEPEVVLAAIPLLPRKDYPGSTGVLIRLLDSERAAVRQAAQKALSGLSYSTFRDRVDELPTSHRDQLGRLVGKADPMAAAAVTADLGAGAAERRLAALGMIETMGLTQQLVEHVTLRTSDADVGVRAEALRLLSSVEPTRAVRDAIQAALADRSTAVSRAASDAWQRLGVSHSPLGGETT